MSSLPQTAPSKRLRATPNTTNIIVRGQYSPQGRGTMKKFNVNKWNNKDCSWPSQAKTIPGGLSNDFTLPYISTAMNLAWA